MSTLTTSIRIPTDEDGFLAFRCPLCAGDFKLPSDAWKAHREATFCCPLCGLSSSRDSMWPREVIAAARAKLLNVVKRSINATMEKMAKSHSRGILKLTYKGFQPQHVREVVAIPDLVHTTLECCGESVKLPLHVAASLFFCPFCNRAQY
jgi:hypothetical protein